MKRLITLIFILAASLYSYAQVAKTISGAVIAWDKSTHDFGDVFQGDKVEHTFRFTNTGNKDLVITNIEVTCGCTIPKGWPRDPIMPGSRGELQVQFDSSGKFGRQNKVVTVVSNSRYGNSQITFSANVLEKKN